MTATSACGRQADAGDIGTVWAAARAALGRTRRDAARATPTVRAVRFETLLDARGRVRESTQDTVFTRSAEPFQTLPPAVLARDGYLVGPLESALLYAPDAQVLLSNEFARDHCFQLVADPRAPELIGLRFTPLPTREVVDIGGIFWMHRESSLLDRVEYRYRDAEERPEITDAGGALSFGMIADSLYGITSWQVRTPLVTRQVVRGLRGMDVRAVPDGARIEGATIALAAQPEPSAATATGRVVGRIEDSSQPQGGLEGARIAVLGSPHTARSDSAGRFEISGVPAGTLSVRVYHERLRLFGVESQYTLELPPDGEATLRLRVPSGPEAYAALCPRSAGAEGRAALVGRVLDAEVDVGVPQAAVLATWRGRLIPSFVRSGAERGATDDIGHFALCDLNTAVRVTLTVVARGYRQAQLRASLRSGAVEERTVWLVACRPDDPPSVCPER